MAKIVYFVYIFFCFSGKYLEKWGLTWFFGCFISVELVYAADEGVTRIIYFLNNINGQKMVIISLNNFCLMLINILDHKCIYITSINI